MTVHWSDYYNIIELTLPLSKPVNYTFVSKFIEGPYLDLPKILKPSELPYYLSIPLHARHVICPDRDNIPAVSFVFILCVFSFII